jgi:phage FluMu gp28-like protein
MNLNDIDTLSILLLEFIKKIHLITLIYNKNIYNFQTNVLNSNNKEEIKPNIIGIRFTAKIMGLELLS